MEKKLESPEKSEFFHLSIRNPHSVDLTENQIYETCGNDFLDAENHYCTPVPSRQSSNTAPLPPSIRSTPSKTNSSLASRRQCVCFSLLFLLVFFLILGTIGCFGYAVSAILGLREEVSALKSEIQSLQRTQESDASHLNESIAREAETRRGKLEELESKMEAASRTLGDQVASNVSSLRSDVQDSLGFLRGNISRNLTLLSDLASLDLVELATNIVSNFSAVSDKLLDLENQTEGRLDAVESTIFSEVSLLNRTVSKSLLELANATETKIDDLGSSLEANVAHFTLDIFTLEQMTFKNITQLMAAQEESIQDLTTVQQSESRKFESLVTSTSSDIRTSTEQENADIRNSISRLANETRHSILTLESETSASLSSLSEEVNRIEVELALEAHGNLSQLNVDILARLNDLSGSLQGRVGNFEEETRETFENFTVRSNSRFADIETRIESNLTQLRDSAGERIDQIATETTTNFTESRQEFEASLLQLQQQVQGSLEQLNTTDSEILAEVQLLYAEVNETAAELDATTNLLSFRVSSEASALRASLADTRDEVSNITVGIQSLDTSIDERFSLANSLVLNLRDAIRTLATESHTNITELERDISEALVVSLNVLKEETQSNISTLATALDHRIAETALNANASLALLASSFFNSLNQVNSSFLSELQKVSSTTAGNLQTALHELSGELFVLYDYTNTSLAEVKVRLDTMDAVILSLNLTAEVSSSAIEEFQATNDATVALVRDVQTNLTSLVAANLELTQAALDSSTESLGNVIGTGLAALEVHTCENLTRLEDDVFSELQRVGGISSSASAASARLFGAAKHYRLQDTSGSATPLC